MSLPEARSAPQSRRIQRFRQADLTRALKAAVNAGMAVAFVRIEPTGAIVIVPIGAGSVAPSPALSEWDA